jgi:hypothetical protein
VKFLLRIFPGLPPPPFGYHKAPGLGLFLTGKVLPKRKKKGKNLKFSIKKISLAFVIKAFVFSRSLQFLSL